MMKKKVLSLLLAILMIIFIMPHRFIFNASALESTGNAIFDAFINDSRYTHGAYWGWDYKGTSFDGKGCCSYASAYTLYCYGKLNPRSGEVFYDAWDIRAGDVITLGNQSDGHGHWLVCLKRSGNKLYVAEGNINNSVRIGWNYTITSGCTFAEDERKFTAGYHYLTHTCDYNASAVIKKAPTQTSTGTRVRTCSCGNTYTQTIPAIPYTTNIKEGVYVIRSKCNSNLVLCTNKISEHNVLLTNFNSSYSDQFWIFIKNSDGTYTIENLYYNNYVIDVYNNSMVNGGNICSYPRKSENYNNERFYIVPYGSYYKLVNKLSYNVVDAEWNNGVSAGTNISQYENGSGDNQLWSFTPYNPILAITSNSITLSEGNSTSVTCSIKPEAHGITIQPTIGDTTICSIKGGDWKGMSIPFSITGKKAGNTYIELNFIDADTKIVYDTQTIKVSVTDTAKPSGTISSTNNVASSQTVTLSMSDNVGLAGYYWGTSSTYSNNTYTAISGTSKSVTKTVSSNGTYYLTVKDTSGIVSSSVSKTFYKTTLNPNNGSVSPTSVLTVSGYSFALPTPSRTGYAFLGWSTSSTATTASYQPGGSFTANANTTLYAVWKANTYTVSYNANGGTGAPASQTKTYGKTLTLSSTKPTRSGYAFVGWATSKTATVPEYLAQGFYKNDESITLYAIWKVPEITLSESNITLKVGDIFGIKATVFPDNSTGTAFSIIDLTPGSNIVWSSSNENVAIVTNPGYVYTSSKYGLVTSVYLPGGTVVALLPGTTVITASFDFKGKTYSATCRITVTASDVVRGDVDGNGEVENTDRTMLARYLAEWGGEYDKIDMAAADIDGNGFVENTDRTILARYLAEWHGEYDTYFS